MKWNISGYVFPFLWHRKGKGYSYNSTCIIENLVIGKADIEVVPVTTDVKSTVSQSSHCRLKLGRVGVSVL